MASTVNQYVGLTQQDITLLAALEKVGAATPMQLEIKTGRIGDDFEDQLERLLERGLVESRELKNGYEKHIYRVSPAGRKLIS
jgi:DNA-binding MarR family transcriptional regulator